MVAELMMGMIDLYTFKLIKKRYGHYASWAVWAESSGRPTDRIGDLSVFDIEADPSRLRQFNPNFILVGLNISRPIQNPLGNFHDRSPHAKDYKLRHALKDTPIWGAYMTDIIKDFEQTISEDVMTYLRANRAFEDLNAQLFKQELKDLGVEDPKILALGRNAFTVLYRHFGMHYEIWNLPHYSANGSKERYREDVLTILKQKDAYFPRQS